MLWEPPLLQGVSARDRVRSTEGLRVAPDTDIERVANPASIASMVRTVAARTKACF